MLQISRSRVRPFIVSGSCYTRNYILPSTDVMNICIHTYIILQKYEKYDRNPPSRVGREGEGGGRRPRAPVLGAVVTLKRPSAVGPVLCLAYPHLGLLSTTTTVLAAQLSRLRLRT